MLFFSLTINSTHTLDRIYTILNFLFSNIPKSAFMKILCDNYLLESVSIKELGATQTDLDQVLQLTQQLF